MPKKKNKKSKNVHLIVCRRPDSDDFSFWPPKIYHDRENAVWDFGTTYQQCTAFEPTKREKHCDDTGQLLFFETSAGFRWQLYLDLEPSD